MAPGALEGFPSRASLTPPGAMKSTACRTALAWASVLLTSVVRAGSGTAVGDPLPEIKVTAVPEPSPIFLLAGAMAVLFLLMRKGGPR
jgi:hypothetical protein